ARRPSRRPDRAAARPRVAAGAGRVMTTAVLERPAATRPAGGGGPARRAMVRWGWRLFRREWRQQLLILGLLTVAVAATTAGLATAIAGTPPARATFVLSASDTKLDADIAAITKTFGPADAFFHH